jgi:hypothetical protein
MIATATFEPLAYMLGIGYVAVGAAIAIVLSRRGHPSGVALGAFACWPLFVPLLAQRGATPSPGPLHARIASTLLDLRDAMAEPGAAGLALPDDLAGLVDDLYRADERLALVDRLLASVELGAGRAAPGVVQGTDELRRARAATAAQIEAVLDGVVQLRLQIGLRALAGNSVPVQERLRDLRGRLAAIDEIAAMELHA